ncbi:MAG: hypothetical protein KAY28_01955 [Cloacibacterium sp.]|nr:hypothetical protein [Cloacibacterium sp.]
MKNSMSNKYFDIHSITETPKAQVEGVFSKYLNKHLQRIENVSELCRIPDNGEVFFLQTEKAFNAFTFIPWIAKKFFIEEIYASTYSISRRVVEALQELQQDGKVGEVTLLISDSMIKRNPQTIDNLEAVAKSNANFKIKYYWNHSKVTLIKTKDHFFVLEGSGNFSENAQLEQYTFCNDADVYQFRKQIFE